MPAHLGLSREKKKKACTPTHPRHTNATLQADGDAYSNDTSANWLRVHLDCYSEGPSTNVSDTHGRRNRGRGGGGVRVIKSSESSKTGKLTRGWMCGTALLSAEPSKQAVAALCQIVCDGATQYSAPRGAATVRRE